MIYVWNFDYYSATEEEYTECQYYMRSDKREDAIAEFVKDEGPSCEYTCTLEDTVTLEELESKYCLGEWIVL